MKDFFKESDFYTKSFIQEYIGSPISGKVISIKDACDYANEKLNKEMEKWPVVYKSIRWSDCWYDKEMPKNTHTALLAFLEELKPQECQHEPRAYFLKETYMHSTCTRCGTKIKSNYNWIADQS